MIVAGGAANFGGLEALEVLHTLQDTSNCHSKDLSGRNAESAQMGSKAISERHKNRVENKNSYVIFKVSVGPTLEHYLNECKKFRQGSKPECVIRPLCTTLHVHHTA